MKSDDGKYTPLTSKTEETTEDGHFWTRAEKRKWLCTLFIGTSALYASRTSVPLLVPAIAQERRWSKTHAGTVLSSFFWGYTLTQVLGGYLSDQIGGHKIILTAAVGWSLFTFWMPQIIRLFTAQETSVNFIVLMRVLHGAFQGVHFPSMSSLTSQHLAHNERASFFSILTSGSAVGTLFTGTFGSYLLDYYGWPTVFYVIGFLGVVWTFFLRKNALALERRKLVISSLSTKHYSSLKEKSPVPWIKLFKRPEFWSCVLGHACQNNCFFLLLSWLPTYFHDTFPSAKGWIVNMVPWLFCIPCTFLGKWLSENLIRNGYSVTSTRKIIEFICLGSEALALILLAQITNYEMALVCMTVAIAATGFHNNAIIVNPQDLAPKHAGSVFGLMNTVGAVPGFMGVYLAGFILDATNSWAAVFQATAAINMMGCAIFLVFGSGNAIV